VQIFEILSRKENNLVATAYMYTVHHALKRAVKLELKLPLLSFVYKK